MSNEQPKICTCSQASAFNFKEIRKGVQVWIHVTCGGEYYVCFIPSK